MCSLERHYWKYLTVGDKRRWSTHCSTTDRFSFAAGLLATGQLLDSVAFLQRQPAVLLYILLLSGAATTGILQWGDALPSLNVSYKSMQSVEDMLIQPTRSGCQVSKFEDVTGCYQVQLDCIFVKTNFGAGLSYLLSCCPPKERELRQYGIFVSQLYTVLTSVYCLQDKLSFYRLSGCMDLWSWLWSWCPDSSSPFFYHVLSTSMPWQLTNGEAFWWLSHIPQVWGDS